MTDLSYQNSGLFTQFYANTPSGIEAWNHAANHDENKNFKILSIHLKKVLFDLRKAGYTVSKEKKSKLTMDEIFLELDKK